MHSAAWEASKMPFDVNLFIRALAFAAERHRLQRRKDAQQSPYLNHLIDVARLLCEVGGIHDPVTLAAGLLHDILEDTQTSPDEIRSQFGNEVLAVIEEVSDDKTLPKAERKQLQILHAPGLSQRAKLVKLADKISNVYDVAHLPPHSWPVERRQGYLDWAQAVAEGLRGTNGPLEACFDKTIQIARARISIDSPGVI